MPIKLMIILPVCVQNNKNKGVFIHPKVKEAEEELNKRKMFLKQVDADLDRSKLEFEVLQDLLASMSLDLAKLESEIKIVKKMDQQHRNAFDKIDKNNEHKRKSSRV